MRKFLSLAVCAAVLGMTPALADTTVTIAPSVDTWVMTQPDTGVTFDGDVVVGTALPETYSYVAVPDSPDYAYVVVNKKRVLVEKKTHKVVKIYK